jgi:hypothetical protein
MAPTLSRCCFGENFLAFLQNVRWLGMHCRNLRDNAHNGRQWLVGDNSGRRAARIRAPRALGGRPCAGSAQVPLGTWISGVPARRQRAAPTGTCWCRRRGGPRGAGGPPRPPEGGEGGAERPPKGGGGAERPPKGGGGGAERPPRRGGEARKPAPRRGAGATSTYFYSHRNGTSSFWDRSLGRQQSMMVVRVCCMAEIENIT